MRRSEYVFRGDKLNYRNCLSVIGLITLFFFFASTDSVTAASMPFHPLLEQAKKQSAERVDYGLMNGARVELTAGGKSFYLLWYPGKVTGADYVPMIVTIHGHASWAFDEFYLWHREASKCGYGILAIQWWSGRGERSQDYLEPQEIYRVIDQVLTQEHVRPGTVLFHGFSRGASNSYAVAALDNSVGKKYFGLIVANAGKANPDYLPVREIMQGRFGSMPFKGTHWVTFAGGKDPNPDRDGINGMRETAIWISEYGGVVERAIEDQNAGHGGFHQNPDNMRSALEVFEQRLKEVK